MLLQMAKFRSFLWLNSITLYIYHIHLSVNRHSGCFRVLAIVMLPQTLGCMYLFELVFLFFVVVLFFVFWICTQEWNCWVIWQLYF